MRRYFAALCAVALGMVAMGVQAQADYAREERWAQEVEPMIVVGDAIRLSAANRKFLAIYAAPPKPRAALIIVHGLGVHPDWNLIGVLRTQLADAGYATLSIQMPVMAADTPGAAYPPLFPEAAERLDAAVKFLRSKSYQRIGIVAHSLGARMTDHYLTHATARPVDTWVAIGISGRYTTPASALPPTLDLHGERDNPAVLEYVGARADVLRQVRGSGQISVPGANHFFEGQEAELVRQVRMFLDMRLK